MAALTPRIIEWGGLITITIFDDRGLPLSLGVEENQATAQVWAVTTLELMSIHPVLRAPDQYDRQTLLATEPA